MIWVFKTKNGEYLMIGARTENEAINIIKSTGMESIYGELHTELKFLCGYQGVVTNNMGAVIRES